MADEPIKVDPLAGVPMNFSAQPDARVPKFCTGIGIEKSEKDMITMSFVHQEPNNHIDNGALINRIIIHAEHAERLIKALQDVLNQKPNE